MCVSLKVNTLKSSLKACSYGLETTLRLIKELQKTNTIQKHEISEISELFFKVDNKSSDLFFEFYKFKRGN